MFFKVNNKLKISVENNKLQKVTGYILKRTNQRKLLEIKNIVNQSRNEMHKFSSRLDIVEGKISKLEDRS